MEYKEKYYIKRGPDFSRLDEISSQKLRESIERILALRTEENNTEVVRLLDKLLGSQRFDEQSLNFEGNDFIWTREDEDDAIYLHEYACGRVIIFNNEAELNNQFIGVKDFLKDAEYIGRKFVRTEPLYYINSSDCAYMDENYAPLVIYSNGAYMLTVGEDYLFGGLRFHIIESKYLYDSKYKFIGEIENGYRDRDAIYEAICAQECSSSLPFEI